MKKILVIAVMAFALAFAACADNAPAEVVVEVVETVVEEAEERGTLIMGTSADFPPFAFVADGGQGRWGQYDGIDVAIGVRVAEQMGMDLIVRDAEFGGLIMDLNGGSIDFISSGMTIRPDRAEHVTFSIPYFTAMQYIAVPAGNPNNVNSVQDLAGLYVGTQLGTTGDIFITDYVAGADVIRYNRINEAFMALRAGTIDAVVLDSATVMMFVGTDGALEIVRDNDAFESEFYGLAVRHEDTELLAAINQVISDMQAAGELEQLFEHFADLLADGDDDETEEVAAAEQEYRGTLIMGTSADFPPFAFVATGGQGRWGQYDGIDVAIGVRVAEQMGMELIVRDAEFGGLIMDLNGGSIDFISSGMTIRPDRAEHVTFSIPYFTAMQYIAVPAGNPDNVNGVQDLAGLYVGVQLGTTGDIFITDYVAGADVIRYNRINEAFMALRAGTIDAVVLDSATVMMFVGTDGALEIVRDNEAFESEFYGLAVRHEDTELLAAINQVIADMQAAGELEYLFTHFADLLAD